MADTADTAQPGPEEAAALVARLEARLDGDATDVDAELELPYARFRAAAALRGTTGRSPWPPEVADPFPDVRGRVPEVAPTALTSEVLAGGILHHGAVLVPGLLGPEELERIRTGTERAFAARDDVDPTGDPHGTGTPWFTPFRPGQNTAGQRGRPHLVRMVDAPRVLQDVLITYRRRGVLDAIAGYLGEPTVVTANKSVLRRLTTPEILPTDFHQDGRFMGDEARSVNVWVTLSDCTGDAPTLDLVPRREAAIHPTGQGDSGFDWTLSAAEVAALAGDDGIVRLELSAGDAMLFDHRLVHRTGYDRSMTQARLALELWCFAPSHVPWQYQPLLA